MNRRLVLALGMIAGCAWAQPLADGALGLVTETGPAKLLRSGVQLEIALRPGDLLFAGDRVTAQSGAATIWFCPSMQTTRLDAGTTVRVEPNRLVPTAGSLAAGIRIPFCPVPAIGRETLARPVFLAAEISRTRGLPTDVDEASALAPATRAAMEAELLAIDQASGVSRDLKESGRGTVFAKYGLHQAAAAVFARLAGQWSSVDWPRLLVHEQHEFVARGGAEPVALGGAGNTYALLVGISDYRLLRPEERLEFAASDAELLRSYLQSPRGGAVPDANIRLLRNREATASAIRNSIAEFLRVRATKNDTVVLFIAAHGVAGSDGSYILAEDSDPDNLRDTGINMLEIQTLLEDGLENVGHVLIFVDVCHAGLIGNIPNKNMARVLQVLARFKGEETFGLLASAPDEKSVESQRFGGGHGAFSYFLSRALNGDADADQDGRITVNELQAYVYTMVRESTRNRQNPRATGDMAGERVLVQDLKQQGIEIAGWQPLETIAQSRPRAVADDPGPVTRPAAADADIERFELAIADGRLLPPELENAFTLLESLRRTLSGSPLQLQLLENELRTALQDRGQEVLLRYLRGEEVPQRRDDFEQGANLFGAALRLDSEALVWQSRQWFCQARAMLFENRYQEAQVLLERAVRLEPEGPYIYNALGLLYLQQASYRNAMAAFRDAIRLAPYWSYPRHNLALALAQAGEYQEAVVVYREAQRFSPQAWFIPYNLGLVQQRVQRTRDAERAFRLAAALAPSKPEPDTALGYLAAARGRTGDAEGLYREAIRKQPSFLPARHNLAVLLSDSGRKAEAIDLWNAVLQDDPGYATSRMALAQELGLAGRNEDALAQYREAVRLDPTFTAASLAAARIQLFLGQVVEVEQQARELLATQPGNAAAWDLLGDALSLRGQNDAAMEAYTSELGLVVASQRKAVERKVKLLRGKRP